jgi:anaphase-promoting complex subunit 8
MRDWHKLDSKLLYFQSGSHLNPPDNRLQPPAPVNNILSELLDEVHDTDDPWLLFLCAQYYIFVSPDSDF